MPDKPFESDGCTSFPDGFWRSCCVAHDRDYWTGGTWRERRASDLRLMHCVDNKCYLRGWWSPFAWAFSRFMYLGVRVFGVSWLPLMHARWGYGWKYPRSR